MLRWEGKDRTKILLSGYEFTHMCWFLYAILERKSNEVDRNQNWSNGTSHTSASIVLSRKSEQSGIVLVANT